MKVTTKEDEQRKAKLNKQINKITRQEKRNKNTEKIEEAVRKGKSLKLARDSDNIGKQQMLALKDKNGKIIKNRVDKSNRTIL